MHKESFPFPGVELDYSLRRSRWSSKKRTFAFLIIVFVLAIYYRCRRRPQSQPGSGLIQYDSINWSRFAYSQYATSSAYLCSAVMVFETLHRLGSRADRILFYPEEWDTEVDSSTDRDSQLLVLARDEYNVQLIPVKPSVLKTDRADPTSWDGSVMKLAIFSQTQYARILHLDSDVMILQNMDDLFFLPSVPAAMPRAYWDYPETRMLSSLVILLEPSFREFKALTDVAQPAIYGQAAVNYSSSDRRFDKDILNKRFADSALVLPHRQYGLVTREFRRKDHRSFLGNDYEDWDPDRIIGEAKLIHFSDSPLPKPWVMWPQALLAEILPRCKHKPGTAEESGCRDRDIWKGLYEDFRKRRKDICKLLSYPAPDWPPRHRVKAQAPSSSSSTNR